MGEFAHVSSIPYEPSRAQVLDSIGEILSSSDESLRTETGLRSIRETLSNSDKFLCTEARSGATAGVLGGNTKSEGKRSA
jgi:hypothetical protein